MNDFLNDYRNVLVNDFKRFFNGRYESNDPYVVNRIAEFENEIRFEEGRKFIKVISGSSVHSFIVKNAFDRFNEGDILKAASWAAPAKNFARGNIINRVYGSVSWAGA